MTRVLRCPQCVLPSKESWGHQEVPEVARLWAKGSLSAGRDSVWFSLPEPLAPEQMMAVARLETVRKLVVQVGGASRLRQGGDRATEKQADVF